MKRLNCDDERKYGLVPSGKRSVNCSNRLLSGLLNDYEKVDIKINLHPSRNDWHCYRLIGVENDNALLREISTILYTEEEKEIIREKIKNDDYSFLNEKRPEVLSEEITKLSTIDICKCHDAYCGSIYIGGDEE